MRACVGGGKTKMRGGGSFSDRWVHPVHPPFAVELNVFNLSDVNNTEGKKELKKNTKRIEKPEKQREGKKKKR